MVGYISSSDAMQVAFCSPTAKHSPISPEWAAAGWACLARHWLPSRPVRVHAVRCVMTSFGSPPPPRGGVQPRRVTCYRAAPPTGPDDGHRDPAPRPLTQSAAAPTAHRKSMPLPCRPPHRTSRDSALGRVLSHARGPQGRLTDPGSPAGPVSPAGRSLAPRDA